ncbi:MAG: diguanylate cyclase [Alphaproteobacteria bacterium]|nr:diguanylate cyclase [Alphaproteobacteria bacterium]
MGNPATILIIGAGSDDGRIAALDAAGYRCASEPAGADILAAIEKHRPGVALVSISGPAGLDLIRAAKANSEAQRVPLAAIDIGDAPGTLADCRKAGADDVFEDDTDGRELVARMQALTRLGGMEAELVRRSATAGEFGVQVGTNIACPPEETGGHLLVVGSEEGEIEALCPLLPKSDIGFSTEPDPYRARSRIEGSEDESFDGALVYVRNEEMREKCDYFCRSVRNDRRLYDLPLFLVTEHGAFPDHGSAYDEGANVVAETPVDCDFLDAHLHLLLRGRDRRRALGRRIAATLAPKTADELGNIYSVEFIRAHLDKLSGDKSSHDSISSAILFFVPTIGEVAALYGMEEAALLRQQLASWLAALVRVEDTVGRTGADEFVALMPDTGLEDAERVRKRIVGVLHQSEFRLTDNVPVGIEVYVQSGLTELQENDSLEDMISRASDLLE